RMSITRRVVTQFEYGQSGLASCSYRTHPDTTNIWRYDVSSYAQTLPERTLLAAAGVDDSSLMQFAARLAHLQLYNDDLTNDQICSFVRDILRTVEGKPIRFTVDIRLSGLAILHEPVVVPLPGGHIQIRATRPDDLCEEIFPFVSQF